MDVPATAHGRFKPERCLKPVVSVEWCPWLRNEARTELRSADGLGRPPLAVLDVSPRVAFAALRLPIG
jgi:hypothetical protein